MPHSAERALEYIGPLMLGMDRSLRTALIRRVNVMVRHLAYLEEREVDSYQVARDIGWSAERLDAVVGLNCFYQIVLAPLASWARGTFPLNLVRDVPIIYGARLRFDPETNRLTRWMMAEFRTVMVESKIPFTALQANQADELITVLGATDGV